MSRPIEIRAGLEQSYADVYTKEALDAIVALAPLNADVKAAMRARIDRRTARARDRERIAFLDPDALIPGTDLTVRAAREGDFEGSPIPHDL
ncbi:MAG: malate synthase, partial [Gemmatimonadota bacterium]